MMLRSLQPSDMPASYNFLASPLIDRRNRNCSERANSTPQRRSLLLKVFEVKAACSLTRSLTIRKSLRAPIAAARYSRRTTRLQISLYKHSSRVLTANRSYPTHHATKQCPLGIRDHLTASAVLQTHNNICIPARAISAARSEDQGRFHTHHKLASSTAAQPIAFSRSYDWPQDFAT